MPNSSRSNSGPLATEEWLLVLLLLLLFLLLFLLLLLLEEEEAVLVVVDVGSFSSMRLRIRARSDAEI